MAYLDAYIRKCPGFEWEGAPNFDTTVDSLRNGHDRRIAHWSQPRWSFRVPFNNNFPDHYRQCLEMFYACRGRLHFFRVRNWLNYIATDWKFGEGDGATRRFKLGKLIEVDLVSVLIEVHALSVDDDAPEPVAYVNGTPAASVFNKRTGEVLFDTPPSEGAELTWSGYFDHWCAFASDKLPASIDNKSGGEFVVNYVADLEEVPPPDEDFDS